MWMHFEIKNGVFFFFHEASVTADHELLKANQISLISILVEITNCQGFS